MQTATIKLQSSDDEEFEVPRDPVCAASRIIRELVEDVNDDSSPIPLPNVDGATLRLVIEYCTWLADRPARDLAAAAEKAADEDNYDDDEESKDDEESDDDHGQEQPLSPWEEHFCAVDQTTLFQLLFAANYMEIQPLLTLTARVVASQCVGKSAKEIRAHFGVEGGKFTGAETEELSAKYPFYTCV